MDASVDPDAEQAPRAVRAAAVLVMLQGAALAAVAVLVLVKTIFGSPDSVGRAVLEAAMALLGTVILVMGGRGLLRLRPAARSPILVIELLALPVSYSLAIQAGRVGYGGPILISALAVLYLLFTPTARDALNRPG